MIIDDLGEAVDDDKQSTKQSKSQVNEPELSDTATSLDADEDAIPEYAIDPEKDTDEPGSLDLRPHSPFFDIPDSPNTSDIIFCTTCGNRIPTSSLCIDGECVQCAKKRVRKLTQQLVSLKAMRPTRKYCILDGHSDCVPDKFHDGWDKITVFGIDFYVPGDICPTCILDLRTYFTEFLEQRGITRITQVHKTSPWQPNTKGRTLKNQIDAEKKFKEFMYAVQVYVNDSESGMAELKRTLRKTTEGIMKKEVSKKWQEEKNLKELMLKTYPSLNLLQKKEALERLSEDEEENVLLMKPVNAEILTLTTQELVKMLKKTFLLIPKLSGEEPEKERLLTLLQSEETLQEEYPRLVVAMRELARSYLDPHVLYVDDVFRRSLELFRDFISNLE